MAPIEPEWMLWANRLREEHKILLNRIDSSVKASAQIELLVEHTKDLTASCENLKQDSNILKEKFRTLEQDVAHGEHGVNDGIVALGDKIAEQKEELSRQIRPLLEQIEDLAARNKRMEQDNDTLLEKVLMLESDVADRNNTLTIKVAELECNMVGFQDEPRSAIEDIQKDRTEGQFLYDRRVWHEIPETQSPTLSPATTADERISERKDSEGRTSNAFPEILGIEVQGNRSLSEYLESGDSSGRRAMQLFEKRLVKAFVTGFADKSLRLALWEKLDERGWTWQQAREETQRIMEKEKSGAKKRKRPLEPESQHSLPI